MKIHTLTNGAKVVSLSPHPFRFSDGTISEAQDADVVASLTLERKYTSKGSILGMPVNEMRMVLSQDQLYTLRAMADAADIVILPFPVLTALREDGFRDQFPNCLAFNATSETQRSAPNDKVVDINNWSY